MGRVKDKERREKKRAGLVSDFYPGTRRRTAWRRTGGQEEESRSLAQSKEASKVVSGSGWCREWGVVAFNGQRPGRGHSNRPQLVIISLHGSVCPSLPSRWTRQEPPAAVAVDWVSENMAAGFFFFFFFWRGRTVDSGSTGRLDGRQGGLTASDRGELFDRPRSAPMEPMSDVNFQRLWAVETPANGIVMSVLSQPLCPPGA